MSSNKAVDRRGFIKYAVGGVIVVAAIGGGAYYITRQPSSGSSPSGSAPAPTPTPAPAPAPKMSEMDKLVEAAKKEGTATIYLGSTPRRVIEGKIDKSFTEKYGIELEYVGGRGTSLIRKFEEENKAGQPVADVVALVDAPMIFGHDQGLFQRYETPQLSQFENQVLDDVIYYGYSISSTIVYNTNLLKKEDVPTTFEELTDPKWKGKVISPMTSTSAYYFLKLQGEDWFRAMKANEMKVNPSVPASREQVATGAFPLLAGLSTASTLSVMAQGQPLDFVIVEPAYGSNRGIALSKTAPHPNAGKLYIEWFLSKETLTPFFNGYSQISRRKGLTVEEPHLIGLKNFIWDTNPEIYAGYDAGASSARKVAWSIFGITRRR